jgi:fatty-acyl-CoA synthase
MTLERRPGLAAAAGGGSCRVVVTGPVYEAQPEQAAPRRVPVSDELALMALNYTSGTTGRPKGVMYHHRGAYPQALAWGR